MNLQDLPPAAIDAMVIRVPDAESAAIALSALPLGQFATVHAVLPGESESDRELILRLIEIGFVPGERVRVVAVGRPGGDPIAVRLTVADSGRAAMNGSTFAMRRHEADFIRVVPDRDAPAGDR